MNTQYVNLFGVTKPVRNLPQTAQIETQSHFFYFKP